MTPAWHHGMEEKTLDYSVCMTQFVDNWRPYCRNMVKYVHVIMFFIASTSNASALLWMWAFQIKPEAIHTEVWSQLHWHISWKLTTLFRESRVSVKMICRKKNRTAWFCHDSLQSMPRKTPSGKHALSSPEHLSKRSQEANQGSANHAAGTHGSTMVNLLQELYLRASRYSQPTSIGTDAPIHKSTTVIAECLFLLISFDPFHCISPWRYFLPALSLYED